MESSILFLLPLLGLSVLLIFLVSAAAKSSQNPNQDRRDNERHRLDYDPAFSILQDPLREFQNPTTNTFPPDNNPYPLGTLDSFTPVNLSGNSWDITGGAAGSGSDFSAFSSPTDFNSATDSAVGALGDSAASSINSDG